MAAASAVFGIEAEWYPQLSVAREVEPWRCNAHDLVRGALDFQRHTQDVWVTAEPLLPEGVADDDHVGPVRNVLVCPYVASQKGDFPEDVE
jgi:hypothetical protein